MSSPFSKVDKFSLRYALQQSRFGCVFHTLNKVLQFPLSGLVLLKTIINDLFCNYVVATSSWYRKLKKSFTCWGQQFTCKVQQYSIFLCCRIVGTSLVFDSIRAHTAQTMFLNHPAIQIDRQNICSEYWNQTLSRNSSQTSKSINLQSGRLEPNRSNTNLERSVCQDQSWLKCVSQKHVEFCATSLTNRRICCQFVCHSWWSETFSSWNWLQWGLAQPFIFRTPPVSRDSRFAFNF